MERAILTDWQDKHARLFGRHTVALKHRLHESPLFSEETLAQLIERYPPELYTLSTMGHDPSKFEWQEGEIGDLGGAQVIDLLRNNRMWLNLRQVADVDPRYRELLEQIYAEFASRMPGFASYKHKLGILISSPRVQVYYHADQPGQSLWQIAGRKTVYVYPNGEPFLAAKDLEGIILRETEEDIPYEPWFDDHAQVYDIGAGEMLHWPLNAPHRVVNHDCLNISVTSEHWTQEVRNSFAVNYANGVLRRSFGYTPRCNRPSGAHVYPKAAFAYAWKKLRLYNGRRYAHRVSFRADPRHPAGIVSIPAYEKG